MTPYFYVLWLTPAAFLRCIAHCVLAEDWIWRDYTAYLRFVVRIKGKSCPDVVIDVDVVGDGFDK